MSSYKTEQEIFWSGAFGDEYSSRNQGEGWVAANTALFTRVLSRTNAVHSVLELGSNVGLNLMALLNLLPSAKISAVEINENAINKLETWGKCDKVFNSSILEFSPVDKWDLVFTKGVLIHINPDQLDSVYDIIYRASNRYMLLAEYYSPTPVEITYRGHSGRLFKRNFAGEMLDRFPDVKLVDYGFVWKQDPNFPQDDITWFLLEK